MNHILSNIRETKQHEVATAKQRTPLSELNTSNLPPTRDFIAGLTPNSLAHNKLAIIAEIKKASPSKGVIRADFDVAHIAKIYETHGANCLSVLTDKPYFQGDHANIALAKAHSSLPVLRKDFIIDPYQIYESRALGADCILLIVALLDNQQLMDYCTLAHELGMAVLVESHTEEELERALRLPTPLMGINNRNLNTFKTDIHTSIKLAACLPTDRIAITESGINTYQDVQHLQKHHIHTFLIGESLMRAPDIGKKLDELYGVSLSNN